MCYDPFKQGQDSFKQECKNLYLAWKKYIEQIIKKQIDTRLKRSKDDREKDSN